MMAILRLQGLTYPLAKVFLPMLMLSFFLDARASSKPKDFFDYTAKIGRNYALDFSNFFPKNRLTLKEIKDESHNFSNYDGFLSYLQKRRPELYENYVLIFDSGSIQYADHEHPRVVLFGDGLILAFAEDPGASDRSVEIMAWNERDMRFDFHELSFRGSSAQLIENPSVCSSCHGSPAKPLWDPYDFWSNAYGAAISRFASQSEQDSFQRIRNKEAKSGVYSYLNWEVDQSRGLVGMDSFTQYVTLLQFASMANQWKSRKDAIKPYIYSILGILAGCANSNDENLRMAAWKAFFPESWEDEVRQGLDFNYRRAVEQRQSLKRYLQDRYEHNFQGPLINFPGHERLAGESIVIAELQQVLSYVGIDLADFTMSQAQNPAFFSTPNVFESDLLAMFLLLDREPFEQLRPTVSAGFYVEFQCKALQEESRQALSKLEGPSASVTRTNPAPSTFGICISCHVLEQGSSGAPAIPFDRTKLLRAWLKEENGIQKVKDRLDRQGSGRMPPDKALSDDAVKDLKEALDRLVKDSD